MKKRLPLKMSHAQNRFYTENAEALSEAAAEQRAIRAKTLRERAAKGFGEWGIKTICAGSEIIRINEKDNEKSNKGF